MDMNSIMFIAWFLMDGKEEKCRDMIGGVDMLVK
jgi:hypothetical protein